MSTPTRGQAFTLLQQYNRNPSLITHADLSQEIARFNQARRRIHQPGSGNYV